MLSNGIDTELIKGTETGGVVEITTQKTEKPENTKSEVTHLKEDDFTKEDDYQEVDLISDDTDEDEEPDNIDSNDTDNEDIEANYKDFKNALENLSDGTTVSASDKALEVLFGAIDENSDNIITKEELEALGIEADSIDDLTAVDIKIIAEAAGLSVVDETSKPEEDEELPEDLLEKLREAFGTNNAAADSAADNSANLAETTPSFAAPMQSYTPSYGGGSTGGTGNVSGTSSVGGNYSTGGSSSGTKTSGAQTSEAQKASDQLSLDELKTEQTEKQSAVDEASAAVTDVASGNNGNVKAAIDDCDKKQELYEKALENDEKVSKELKEEQKQNQEDISNKENEIKDEETAISEDEEKIYNLENEISSLNSQLESYKTSLSNLPEKTEDNKSKHSEIDAMKKQINDSIDDINNQIDTKEKEKEEAEKDKSDRETNLKTLQDDLKDLEETRDEIEKKIADSCSDETKQKLEDFQAARKNIETVKAEELQKAQEELNTAKSELEEVNASIQELEAMQIQLQNRVGDNGEDVVEFAKNLDGLSASEMKQIMQSAGCQFDSGAWCADFCTYVTKQVYGNDATPGDFANNCSNTAYCPTIGQWARNKGVYTTDSSKVQPGDYILYGSAGSERHIGIVTSVNSDGTVNTIEGNTSDDNGNYTDGVVNQHSNRTGAYVLMHELA